MAEYELDPHEELLLLAACRTARRLDRLAAKAAAAPVPVANARGDLTAHPALTEARQQSLALARLLWSPNARSLRDRDVDLTRRGAWMKLVVGASLSTTPAWARGWTHRC